MSVRVSTGKVKGCEEVREGVCLRVDEDVTDEGDVGLHAADAGLDERAVELLCGGLEVERRARHLRRHRKGESRAGTGGCAGVTRAGNAGGDKGR